MNDSASAPTLARSRCRTLLRLRTGARVLRANGDADLHLAGWPHGELVAGATDVQRAMLARLSSGFHTQQELCGAVLPHSHDRSGTVAEAAAFLAHLDRGGWLSRSVIEGDRPLYRVVPVKPHGHEVDPRDCRWRLSRFAVLRPDGASMVLECPSASAEVHLDDASLVGILGRLGTAGGMAAGAGGAESEPAQMFLTDLLRTGFLVPCDVYEDEEQKFRHWKAQDLWFHARSRSGSRGRPRSNFGATFWGRSSFPQPPARPVARPGPAIDLYAPDIERLRAADVSLTSAVEDRASLRLHDDGAPVSLRQIGEFLYRCARVRDVRVIRGAELLDLPYPAGGGLGELEIYLVVRAADELAPGLYHYDRHGHRLEPCQGRREAVQQLMLDAAASAGGIPLPQVLVVITARFARVMWKYEGMAYAAILKHVGVLYELMYLVATAMRLAPCALGAGNAELFSEAAGLDYFEESSVGEFLLGSRLPRNSPTEGQGDGSAPA